MCCVQSVYGENFTLMCEFGSDLIEDSLYNYPSDIQCSKIDCNYTFPIRVSKYLFNSTSFKIFFKVSSQFIKVFTFFSTPDNCFRLPKCRKLLTN